MHLQLEVDYLSDFNGIIHDFSVANIEMTDKAQIYKFKSLLKPTSILPDLAIIPVMAALILQLLIILFIVQNNRGVFLAWSGMLPFLVVPEYEATCTYVALG